MALALSPNRLLSTGVKVIRVDGLTRLVFGDISGGSLANDGDGLVGESEINELSGEGTGDFASEVENSSLSNGFAFRAFWYRGLIKLKRPVDGESSGLRDDAEVSRFSAIFRTDKNGKVEPIGGVMDAN